MHLVGFYYKNMWHHAVYQIHSTSVLKNGATSIFRAEELLVWGHRISYNLNFWLKFRTLLRNISCSFNLKIINFCISKQTTASSVRIFIILQKGYAVAQLVQALRYKLEGRRFDGVTGTFQWHNPSGCTMALGLTQPLTEMSTRNISWG